jgi:hypothetical protein
MSGGVVGLGNLAKLVSNEKLPAGLNLAALAKGLPAGLNPAALVKGLPAGLNPAALAKGLPAGLNPAALAKGLPAGLNPAAALSGVMGAVAPSSAPYAGSVKNGIYNYIADNGAKKLIVAIVILSLFVIAYIVIVIVLIYVMVRLMRRSLRLIMKKHYASGFSQGIFGFFGMILVISAVIFSPVSIAASYTEEIGQFVEGLL